MNNNYQPPMQVDPYGGQYLSHPNVPQQFGYSDRFSDDDESDSIDLLKILWVFVHYRWLIAACLITGLVCGAFFTFIQTPKFRATAQMEIQTASAKVIEDIEV